MAAKQTIPSTELDISELTAESLARIVMILIEAQMETTKGDMCPPFRDIPRSLISSNWLLCHEQTWTYGLKT